MHLIIDGKADNVGIMIDEVLLKEWLGKTVKLAGMTPFGEPYIKGFPWPGSKDWTALTGFQPLMESGLSIHCWPERRYVFIDLFSCNEFDWVNIVGHIVRSFRMDKPTVIVLDRGIDTETGDIIPARLKADEAMLIPTWLQEFEKEAGYEEAREG